MIQNISYKGHRLNVGPHSGAWRVFIFKPGSIFAEFEIPNGTDRETCIAEAKLYVDKLLK